MKITLRTFLWKTCAPVVGITALGIGLGFGIFGCSKADDPEAITLSELKYPSGLALLDLGNGSMQLTWIGLNNEKDFDGFNIYGMKGAAADFGLTEGKSLQLLDDKGEPVEATKTILNKFNYDPDKGLEAAGTAVDAEKKFSYYPIHTKSGEDRLLPTCKPTGSECKATTKENLGKSVGDLATIAPEGPVSYTVSGLKPGSSYCFIVFASKDEGKSVSQTSSEARCIVPKYSVTATGIDAVKNGDTRALDLAALRAACAGGTCGTVALVKQKVSGTETTADCGATTDQAVCFEYFGTEAYLTAGKNTAVQDLGYYLNGFSDVTLPKVPALIDWSADLQNKDGFSISGQSIVLQKSRVYVIATSESTAAGDPATFYYHWLYISEKTNNGSDEANFGIELRISNMLDAR